MALESGFDPKFIEERGESAPGKNRFAYAFLGRGTPGVMGGMSASDFLWTIQYRVIQDLAEKGPCVIVGRCADYILREREDCLHTFIHAAVPFRPTASSGCTASRRRPRRSGWRTRTPAAG